MTRCAAGKSQAISETGAGLQPPAPSLLHGRVCEMRAAKQLPLGLRTAETRRAPAGADRQTDRHGDTTHRAGRQTEVGTEQPAHLSGQVLSLKLAKFYSNQATRTSLSASSPALQKCPWLGSHQNLTNCTTRAGRPSLFINALENQHFILSSINYSFWEDRREDFCKAEITPPNTGGMLPMKPREVLRGRAKVTQFIRQP